MDGTAVAGPLARVAPGDAAAEGQDETLAAASWKKPKARSSAWLSRYRQTGRLREWLWEPLAVAALNQSPDDAAAAPFVRVLALMFGPDPTFASIVLPVVPLDTKCTRRRRAVTSKRAAEKCAATRWHGSGSRTAT